MFGYKPEILMIPEADVFSVAECSIHTTVSRVLRSWNIAESSGALRGDVSQSAVSDHSTVSMGVLGFSGCPICSLRSKSMRYQAYKRQDTANGVLGVAD